MNSHKMLDSTTYFVHNLDSYSGAAQQALLKKQWLKNNGYSANKIWLILTFMMWYERWMR